MGFAKEIAVKKQYAFGKLRMALDAAYRALSGLDSDNFSYACGQLQRVEQYAHDARFAADLADLLRVQADEGAKANARPAGQCAEKPTVCDSDTPAS